MSALLPRHLLLGAALLMLLGPLPRPTLAAEALVAVAANFAEVMEQLADDFTTTTGHTLTVASGSTGKLYAQIVNGAPFDVLLAADQIRPLRLEEEEFAVMGSRFTYAVGQLVLWSVEAAAIGDDGAEVLQAGAFRFLAIAQPKLAPYGAAARQTLQKLQLWEPLAGRIVQGENIGQTFAMVASGNAELGFVALSYVLSPRNKTPGSHWVVPTTFYDPIRQDAVLLQRGADNGAAVAFMDYLRSPEARQLIQALGYGLEE